MIRIIDICHIYELWSLYAHGIMAIIRYTLIYLGTSAVRFVIKTDIGT